MSYGDSFGWMSAGVRIGDVWSTKSGRLFKVTYKNEWDDGKRKGTEIELTPVNGGDPFFVPIQSLVLTYDRVG